MCLGGGAGLCTGSRDAAAFLFLPPLLCLPFLACTDSPVEAETDETTALFKSDKPLDPGIFHVEISVSCKAAHDLPELNEISSSSSLGYVASIHCDPGVLGDWPGIGITGDDVDGCFAAATEDGCCSCDGDEVTVAELVEGEVSLPGPGDFCVWTCPVEDCTDWFLSELGTPVKLKLISWGYY